MSLIKINTKQNATQMVVHLTSVSGLKQTKVREQFADLLGYRSYNGLIGALGKSPILFHLDDLLPAFCDIVTKRNRNGCSVEMGSVDWWASNHSYSSQAQTSQVKGYHVIKLRITDCDLESGEFRLQQGITEKLLIEELIDSGIVEEGSPLFRGDERLTIESHSQNSLWGESNAITAPTELSDSSYSFVMSSIDDIGIPDARLTFGHIALYIPVGDEEGLNPSIHAKFNFERLYEVYSAGDLDSAPTQYTLKPLSVEYVDCPSSGAEDPFMVTTHSVAPCSKHRQSKCEHNLLPAPFPSDPFHALQDMELEQGKFVSFQLTDSSGLYQCDTEYLPSAPISFQSVSRSKRVRFAYESFLTVRALYSHGVSKYRDVVLRGFNALNQWSVSNGYQISVILMGDGRGVASMGGLGVYSCNKYAAVYGNNESSLQGFAEALADTGVVKVKANELSDPQSGELLASTLVTYDAFTNERDHLHVESLLGYGLAYEAYKEALDSTLQGGFEVDTVYRHEFPVEVVMGSVEGGKFMLCAPKKQGDIDQLSFVFLRLIGDGLTENLENHIGEKVVDLSLKGRQVELGGSIQTPVLKIPVGDISGLVSMAVDSLGVSMQKDLFLQRLAFVELLKKSFNDYFSILESQGRPAPCQYGTLTFFNRMHRDMLPYGLSVSEIDDSADGRLVSGADLNGIGDLMGGVNVEQVRFYLSNNALD